LPEICGYLCESKELCEKHCVRAEFASKAVRIRDLHRWVIEYVGEEGWVKPVSSPNGKSVCVIGAGPAGLTCAHYLVRLGYTVELLDRRGKLGGELRDLVEKGILDEGALERDLSGLMLPSISFRGDTIVADLDLMGLSRKYAAVYVSIEAGGGKSWGESLGNMPNVILSDKVYSPGESGCGFSQAVADGRKAAEAIDNLDKR
jgi:NADPH-dependent glutamate synthase beta subunit-like oxidoreductase